jgi:hypothetical protein
MNAPLVKAVTPAIGCPFEGGFYAGDFKVGDQAFALIVSPKAEGEHDDIAWNGKLKSTEGALSYCDGLANTEALAAAGSELAKWALDLVINGVAGWYIPAQDELEIIYRNLKPSTDNNYCYARSGINVSALGPTYPYTPNLPVQTTAELFIKGGAEAMQEAWYWSSTQHASNSGYAWVQRFTYGNQDLHRKSGGFHARAVRRLVI